MTWRQLDEFQIEYDVGLSNTAPTNAVRKGGYTQISAKVVEVSSTNQAVNGVANAQTVAKQVAYKLSELKRDMEAMLLDNVAANAGASGTARATAGLPAYLTSNVSRGTGGANGTTSGTGEAGFVNAAATDGTLRPITEALLKGVIADCWNAGATPKIVMCGSAQKQKISTFTGNATRYKEAGQQIKCCDRRLYLGFWGSSDRTQQAHEGSHSVQCRLYTRRISA